MGSFLLDVVKTRTVSSVEAALQIPKTQRGIKPRIEQAESGPQSSLSNPTSLLRSCPTGDVSETLPFPLYFGDHLSLSADFSSDFLSRTKHRSPSVPDREKIIFLCFGAKQYNFCLGLSITAHPRLLCP